MTYESLLELGRVLLADFDGQVSDIREQPFRLTAIVGGRARAHVPDFLLIGPSMTASVVNVKPAERLRDPRIAARLAWPRRLVTGHGWAYEVWSGCDPMVLSNVRFLAGYRRPMVVPLASAGAAASSVRDGEQLAAAESRLAGTHPRHTVRPALLAALWHGLLVTDLTRPLSGSSVLRIPR